MFLPRHTHSDIAARDLARALRDDEYILFERLSLDNFKFALDLAI